MMSLRSRMPDSDDESVDEDEEKCVSETPLDASAADTVVVVNNPTLLSIGEQIMQIELEIKEARDARMQEWMKRTLPSLKSDIAASEGKVDTLRGRIKSAVDTNKDEDTITAMRKELKRLKETLDEMKRHMYFPQSLHSGGSDGLYCALDSFWLQHISGSFEVELQPPMGTDTGKVILVLSGEFTVQ